MILRLSPEISFYPDFLQGGNSKKVGFHTQVTTLKKIMIEATLKKSQVAHYKNSDTNQIILRVQIKRSTKTS